MNMQIVTMMTRGQITLPKKLRDKYGIVPGNPVKIIDEGMQMVIKPLVEADISQNPSKPKYTSTQYKKVLDEVTSFMKQHGPLWAKADDKRRKQLQKLDEAKWKKLNW